MTDNGNAQSLQEVTIDGETYGSGYSGSGYISHLDLATGNSVSTTINVAAAGTHNIDFRYSNGTGASSTLSVHVNGTKIKNVTFPVTGAWNTTWATVTSAFTLNAGNNTIKIQYDAGNGPTDIDYIVVW
ncbi:CBM35 domain-containing protein [Cohnella soli]|uniref:CBM35 domain-containing protein n=1 Tax=Cohnella soli TaxID=425005 RepID=A0ABW0HSZ9_9BACL